MKYKKIALDASREEIEAVMNRAFTYPRLYQSNTIVDGDQEALLPVVVMHSPNTISFAIWGVLPQEYQDEWGDFQQILQTLHVPINKLEHHTIFNTAFKNGRCLIVVTGFFIYHMHKGSLYPYYVYAKGKKPFCLAGITTTLDDGFITVAMLMKKSHGPVKKIQNIESQMPIPIAERYHNSWLANDIELKELKHITNKENQIVLHAHPIARDFFKNNIRYSGTLDPVHYDDIPIL